MPELFVQAHLTSLIWCVLMTLGCAVATAATIGERFNFKPFNCIYCLTFWWSLFFCLCSIGVFGVGAAIMYIVPVHITAYTLYQKAL